MELYNPAGKIEIAYTARYSWKTGKNELCVLARTPLKKADIIPELKGSLAPLTAKEDDGTLTSTYLRTSQVIKDPNSSELRRTDRRGRDNGISRDFSVIHSKAKGTSQLFLGPARFVNVSTRPPLSRPSSLQIHSPQMLALARL